MMRKKASRLFGQRQSEDFSRPPSSLYNPLRFPNSSSASITKAQSNPQSKTQPRTLVMSTADIWEQDEDTNQQDLFAPRLSLDPVLEGFHAPEPLFNEDFLATWDYNYDEMTPLHFSQRLLQLQNETVYYNDDDDDDADLSDSEFDEYLDDIDDDEFPPEPLLAVSISVMHVGPPKVIDLSPTPFSYARPTLRSRYASVSSHTSSDESDGHGSTFSHHSAASSVSEWTKSGRSSIPTSPTTKSSRYSSDYMKASEDAPIPVPPRSRKRDAIMSHRPQKESVHDDSDASSENGSSSSSTYNYTDYDWNYLNSEVARTMRTIRSIQDTV